MNTLFMASNGFGMTCFLRSNPIEGHLLPSDLNQTAWDDMERDKKLYCTTCHHFITSHQEQITIGSGHEHTFFNPHGIVFHLGCFRRAPGCVTEGIPSLEFTWFKGYAWTLAGCGKCRRHLGWQFVEGASHSFYALILNRIKEHHPGSRF